jgi:general secretion pathway protein G
MKKRYTLILSVFTVIVCAVLVAFIWEIHWGRHGTSPQALENTLKSDLAVLRMAIENYTIDKQQAPTELQDLVKAGYIRELPIDPMTHKNDWVIVTGSTTASKTKFLEIIDVHSASTKKSTNTSTYNTW